MNSEIKSKIESALAGLKAYGETGSVTDEQLNNILELDEIVIEYIAPQNNKFFVSGLISRREVFRQIRRFRDHR